MFSKRVAFSRRLKFDQKSFDLLVKLLREAGFNEIKIKIPSKGYEKFLKTIFTPEEFVALQYNFLAVILLAKNATDEIKILFVNSSQIVSTFDDVTFPSAHSVSSSFFVASCDPTRLVGLTDFVNVLLTKSSLRHLATAKLQSRLYVITNSILYLLIVSLAISKNGFGIFIEWAIPILGFLVFSFLYIFYFITHPGGIYIADFEHPILSFLRRLSVGDFKNNLVLAFIIKFFKVIGAILLALFSGFLWLYIETPLRMFLGIPK